MFATISLKTDSDRLLVFFFFFFKGAILPLTLGLIITAFLLLLFIIGCRIRLVRHKIRKARPLTTEESDYLINGMYL